MAPDALAVLCPTCAAPKGQPCRSFPEAAPRDAHKDRLTLATRQSVSLSDQASRWREVDAGLTGAGTDASHAPPSLRRKQGP